MKLTCPSCAAIFPIDAALTDEQARQAVAAALKLPAPLGDRILRYLGLFRPATRALSWDRATNLLTELLVPIQAGQVTRDGTTRPAPLELWTAALDAVLESRDRLRLPLKSHGYLFEVASAMADKAAGRHERQAETRRQAGALQPGQTKQVRNTGLRPMFDYTAEESAPIKQALRAALRGQPQEPPPEDQDAGE